MSKSRALKIAAASAIALLLVTGGGSAYAKEGADTPTDEAKIMSSAKVSMSEAMATAEKSIGGKAVGSGIEDQNGVVHFEVDILKDGARQKVLVDPQTGQVVKNVAANNDDDDD